MLPSTFVWEVWGARVWFVLCEIPGQTRHKRNKIFRLGISAYGRSPHLAYFLQWTVLSSTHCLGSLGSLSIRTVQNTSSNFIKHTRVVTPIFYSWLDTILLVRIIGFQAMMVCRLCLPTEPFLKVYVTLHTLVQYTNYLLAIFCECICCCR